MARAKKKVEKAKDNDERVVAQNRAASYNYHLMEKFEAGMVLRGTEVKALRAGKANIREAYATVRGHELWLLNCHIAQYQPGGPWNHEPLGPRKLLVHKSELRKLIGKTDQKGLTLIPLRIYFRNGIAKCQLALAKGKKQWDRRQTEREKEARHEMDEAIYRAKRR